MSNPLITTSNSKLDTRVKEPSGVGSPTLDRFKVTTKICQMNIFSTSYLIAMLFKLLVLYKSTNLILHD